MLVFTSRQIRGSLIPAIKGLAFLQLGAPQILIKILAGEGSALDDSITDVIVYGVLLIDHTDDVVEVPRCLHDAVAQRGLQVFLIPLGLIANRSCRLCVVRIQVKIIRNILQPRPHSKFPEFPLVVCGCDAVLVDPESYVVGYRAGIWLEGVDKSAVDGDFGRSRGGYIPAGGRGVAAIGLRIFSAGDCVA